MLRGGVPVGTYFGIPVRLHASWFIIFALITVGLGAGYFPTVYPDWNQATYWGIAVATSLLFFISVLLHELAHSVVAQRAGIRIDSITLFVLGGVSQMTREPDSPGEEFRVAVVGPAASLVISAIFWGIWAASVNVSEPLAGLAFWLGWINLILAGFNLLPGFPLDGGRVLRSILWWRQGSLVRATRTAAGVGRVVGYLMLFGGIWLIFTGYWLNGIWLGVIGWFLQVVASQSYRQVVVKEALRGHTVGEVMAKDCPTVSSRTSIDRLVHDHILESGKRCFPVVDNGHSLGLVSISDVKKVPGERRAFTTVAEAMTPMDRLRLVNPGDDLSSVLDVLTREDVNQLPVVERGNIVGMVGRDNVMSLVGLLSELGA
jgi:Zn-dependent protease